MRRRGQRKQIGGLYFMQPIDRADTCPQIFLFKFIISSRGHFNNHDMEALNQGFMFVDTSENEITPPSRPIIAANTAQIRATRCPGSLDYCTTTPTPRHSQTRMKSSFLLVYMLSQLSSHRRTFENYRVGEAADNSFYLARLPRSRNPHWMP